MKFTGHFGALVLLLAMALAPVRAATVAEMKAQEAQVKAMVARNLPAVVSLMGESVPGAGSGTIISADGLILTAAHVTKGNETMTVIFPNGQSVKCKVLGENYGRDVSLAKIETPGTYPFVELGDSDKLEETSDVVAMGHPGGFDLRRTPPVRIGRINMKDQGGFLVSDCTLVGGDSGGPLFDLDGKLVGIHSSISVELSFNRDAPVNAAKNDWDKLLAGKRWGRLSGESAGDPNRAVLGAVLDPESQDGVALVEVRPNSPAAGAGLKPGDRIVAIAGAKVENTGQLRDKLSEAKPGATVEIAYVRDAATAKASLTLISEAELVERMEQANSPADAEASEPQPEKKQREKIILADVLREEFAKLEKQIGDELVLELALDGVQRVLAELLVKHGVAEAKIKDAKPRALLQMMEEQNADETNGFYYEGLAELGGLLTAIDPEIQGKLNDQFAGMLDAHRPGSLGAAKATFVLRDGKKPKVIRCFATAIDADGWLLTKASEVKGAKTLQCMVKGKWVSAVVAQTWKEHDLALVKVDAKELPVVAWSEKEAPVIGTYITAVAPEGSDPIAIGVVSVAARSQQLKGRGFLGVQLASDAGGLKIEALVPGGAAKKAGVEIDDKVLELDGKKPASIFEFTKLVSDRKAGDKLVLKLQRGEEQLEKEVVLGDLGANGQRQANPRASEMDSMGSTVSKRRGNFGNVIQTDFPLDANQCGGPVTDLDGNAVGLIIARSGRVETMIIPSNTLRDLLAEVDFAKQAADLVAPAF
jgi:serine protease Do